MKLKPQKDLIIQSRKSIAQKDQNPKRQTIKQDKQDHRHNNNAHHHQNKGKGESHFIGRKHHAPEFHCAYHHVEKGYRINYDNFWLLVKSLFQWHNETVNIHSHLIGSLFALGLMFFLIFGNVQYSRNIQTSMGEAQTTILSQIKERIFNPCLDEIINIENQIVNKISTLLENTGVLDKYHEYFDELDHQVSKSGSFKEIDQLFKNYLEYISDQRQELEQMDSGSINVIREKMSVTYQKLKNRIVSQLDSDNYDWVDPEFLYATTHAQTPDKAEKNQIKEFLDHKKSVHRWPLFVFLTSAFLCMFFSACFHLVYVFSPQIYKIFLRLDYAGISFLITGSTFPPYYYGFFCADYKWGPFYLWGSSLVSVIVFLVSLKDFIHTHQYFTAKSIMYLMLGVISFLPAFHLVYYEKQYTHLDQYSSSASLPWYALSGFTYVAGLATYTYKCPQRFQQESFDYCGASHQLFHFAIFLGVIFTYIGAMINYHTRIEHFCKA